MQRIARLRNPIMSYAWGSRRALRALRGLPGESSTPEAELWLGDHPKAPSEVDVDGAWKTLPEVIASDPDAVLVRTSLMWSRLGDGGPQVALVRNPEVRFFVDEFRNPVHAASVAAACLELVGRSDISGPLHVAGPERVDRLTFARALAPLAGVDPSTLQGGTGADQPGRPADVSLDSSLAASLLDTKIVGLP